MRKHNNFYIIGVDAGYGNMKTARTIYPTGLVAMDTKPFFDGDILEYNGIWYRVGEGHKAYNPDKTGIHRCRAEYGADYRSKCISCAGPAHDLDRSAAGGVSPLHDAQP